MKILIVGGSGFIGTNYIEFLLRKTQADFLNIDNLAPKNPLHRAYWKKCDLMDVDNLKKIVSDYSPTDVVYLAAKVGVHGSDSKAFSVNTEGLKNFIDIINDCPSLKRVIFTSSLLVCKVGYTPKNDTDYCPNTAYGASKAKGEELIRVLSTSSYAKTIIRPISIWGPWGDQPYKNLFKSIMHGWYFHIGSGHYKRSLGYVGNFVHQIHQILLAPKEAVDNKVIYLADYDPTDLYEMTNLIAKTAGAKKIRHIPLFLMKIVAKFGDIFMALGWKGFPMNSFRLNNILTQYVFDMSAIKNIAGKLPYSAQEGIEETINWLRKEPPIRNFCLRPKNYVNNEYKSIR
ncbi:MAG: NAD(P)-dependent oxidoreductase [Elusimicrobia bacterium]|nr:NAD(P)-dependent oxidoreductase [Elusimicrobiota bacterium]